MLKKQLQNCQFDRENKFLISIWQLHFQYIYTETRRVLFFNFILFLMYKPEAQRFYFDEFLEWPLECSSFRLMKVAGNTINIFIDFHSYIDLHQHCCGSNFFNLISKNLIICITRLLIVRNKIFRNVIIFVSYI